jgi:trypsin-like peptidase
MKQLVPGIALALVFALNPVAQAIEAPALVRDAKTAPSPPPPPMRLAEKLATQPMHSLMQATQGAADELAALNAWNRQRNSPPQNGFSRPLELPLKVRLAAGGSREARPVERGGGWLAVDFQDRAVWGTSIQVPESHRLRIELRDVDLPTGTRLWVWGEGEEPIAFDLSLLAPDRTLWTPSVAGPTLYLEVAAPLARAGQGAASFGISRIAELFALDEEGQARVGAPLFEKEIFTCALDAACFTDAAVPGIALWKKGISLLQFMVGANSFVCSGGLLNDTHSDFVPYLLTAHHCLSSQTSVSTLEAFWDFLDSSCLGTAPLLASLPRSTGGTLLASDASSDYTFIRLSSAPGSRVFLGWNAASTATAPGTPLYRLSHPHGIPMGYSKSASWNPPVTCSGLPVSSFLYSDPQPELGNGSPFPGSSGSPVLLANGQVVGQLFGACGPNVAEPCLAGSFDSDIDGRFSATFPALAAWLAPAGGTGPCVQDGTTACLLNGRFKATVRFRAAFDNAAADTPAQRKSVTGFASSNFETAFFYFNSSDNVEVLLKMLDQGNTDSQGHPTIAVLFGSATPLRVEIAITDTQTGAMRTYSSAFSSMQGATDFTAFVK